jgi:hypothetical protein
VAQQAWWAWRKAEQRCAAAVQAEAAAAQIETVLALFRPAGWRSARQWAQGQSCAALAELHGQQWGKGRRRWSVPRTLNQLAWVHKPWTQAVEEPLVREAATRLWYWRAAMALAQGQKRVHLAQGVVSAQVVCQRLSPQWHQAYERGEQIGRGVVRASSAVEGLPRGRRSLTETLRWYVQIPQVVSDPNGKRVSLKIEPDDFALLSVNDAKLLGWTHPGVVALDAETHSNWNRDEAQRGARGFFSTLRERIFTFTAPKPVSDATLAQRPPDDLKIDALIEEFVEAGERIARRMGKQGSRARSS